MTSAQLMTTVVEGITLKIKISLFYVHSRTCGFAKSMQRISAVNMLIIIVTPQQCNMHY